MVAFKKWEFGYICASVQKRLQCLQQKYCSNGFHYYSLKGQQSFKLVTHTRIIPQAERFPVGKISDAEISHLIYSQFAHKKLLVKQWLFPSILPFPNQKWLSGFWETEWTRVMSKRTTVSCRRKVSRDILVNLCHNWSWF